MKKKKLFIIKSISLIFIFLIYKILEYILRLKNLDFMNIIVYLFISIFTILILSILIQIISTLYNITKGGTVKLPIRIISGVGATLVTFSMIILIIFGFIAFTFTHQPEHIVKKEGKRMVAYVNSFLEVEVNYYDYINPFVRGNRLKINESYGNGGYDPFKSDEMPAVKQYIYYDENGKVIKSSYNLIQ